MSAIHKQPKPDSILKLLLLGASIMMLLICACTKGLDKTTRFTFPEGDVGDTGKLRQAPPSSQPTLDDEIWVITRSPARADSEDGRPGSGSLWTELNSKEVAIPLKHTDVKAGIAGTVASVTVQQQFHNPYDSKIEAIYVFPLPDNAAVNEFLMVIGQRRIRGIVRERAEAERVYVEAKRQGYLASLLTQERPNLFTQSVANIEPGREVDVTITYFHTLPCQDDWFEFHFPMVIGPRFNPPRHRRGVGAVAQGRQGDSGQPDEVSYLKPHERSGHDIAVEVALRPGMEIEETSCRTHEIETEKLGPGHTRVRLSPRERVPNKDFVLRYRLAGSRIKSALLTHHDERGGFFTLTLMPPRSLEAMPRRPVELIFVLDSSGSMSGAPLEQARAAIARGLEGLEPTDTFQLIDFSDSASSFGPEALAATPHNLGRARRYLDRIRASGGTMMLRGIQAALDFPHDPERLRFVCFLTDGFIGNEQEILREIHRRLGESRIFSFGVGSAPNRYLLNGMARFGRGAVAYLGLNDSGAAVMEQFLERISHAALTDIRIDWGELDVAEVFPRRVPDLWAGRPVVLTGRFSGRGRKPVRISGWAGSERVQMEVPAEMATDPETAPSFPSLWARAKLSELSDQATYRWSPFLPKRIKQVALDYGLVSEYTAFVERHLLDSFRKERTPTVSRLIG